MKELELKVKGMMCNGCENRVKNALKTINGVENVEADHKTGIVKIKINGEIDENLIKNQIIDIGFSVE